MNGSLSNLQITRTDIKSWTSSTSGQTGLFTLEFFALELENFPIDFLWIKCCGHDSAFIFIRSSTNVHKTRTNITSRTCLNSGQICLLTSELLAHEPRKFYLKTYDGETVFFILACSVFVAYLSNLQVTRADIKCRKGVDWGQISSLLETAYNQDRFQKIHNLTAPRLNCFCVGVLRPSQQLRSCRAGQLPINTVPGQV